MTDEPTAQDMTAADRQLLELKAGPRAFSPEQTAFIEAVAASRPPLAAHPLSISEGSN